MLNLKKNFFPQILGLVAAFIGCHMEEFEGKVYVYGVVNEDKYQELTAKFQQLGCSKCKMSFFNLKKKIIFLISIFLFFILIQQKMLK